MAVSRPGFQSAGGTLLIPHERRTGATIGLDAAPSLGLSALRHRAPRTDAAPRFITFTRLRARYVRVTIEPPRVTGPRTSIKTLSVIDGDAPTVDLALRKHATASSSLSARVPADGSSGPGSAVDGNPCTGWTPAAGDSRPWIHLDLGAVASFDQICLMPDAPRSRELGLCVSVSADGETWIDPEAADDSLTALHLDLGAAAPPCPANCEPVHVHVDPRNWQVFAVNHTAQRISGAGITARVYEPFGRQLSHVEQRDLIVEPLSVAPGFIVSRPAYLPPTHLLSLELHGPDGRLLSEHNCWRYRATQSAGAGSASSALIRRAGATAR